MLYEGKQWFEPAQGVPASVHVKTARVRLLRRAESERNY